MGDIADMMLEGLLDEETGEYIGDRNLKRYGTEAPGFPISYDRQVKPKGRRVPCNVCGKKVKKSGLQMHKRDVHGR